ncbi:MAG: hypothetical protein ACXAE3_17535, partial [Candidatus Kariarchaeaceae archaeon]
VHLNAGIVTQFGWFVATIRTHPAYPFHSAVDFFKVHGMATVHRRGSNLVAIVTGVFFGHVLVDGIKVRHDMSTSDISGEI